jgi:hypothetical protein
MIRGGVREAFTGAEREVRRIFKSPATDDLAGFRGKP